jgi:hypothetical protein
MAGADNYLRFRSSKRAIEGVPEQGTWTWANMAAKQHFQKTAFAASKR